VFSVFLSCQCVCLCICLCVLPKHCFYSISRPFVLNLFWPMAPCQAPHPQAANLLCAQANSASYPQRDGKWVVAHGLQGEGLVGWLGRWYACVLHRGSNCSPSRAMDGRIMRHGIICSCQSAATSEIVNRCCSSLVSSAITSTQTFIFYLYHPVAPLSFDKKMNFNDA